MGSVLREEERDRAEIQYSVKEEAGINPAHNYNYVSYILTVTVAASQGYKYQTLYPACAKGDAGINPVHI